MSLANILLIIVLVALNGFFVAIEFSAVSTRRARLDLIANPDSRSSRIVHSWIESNASRDRLIAGSQLGITLVSLALGAVGENALEAWLDPYFAEVALPASLALLEKVFPVLPLVISLTVVTSLHVVLGEQVPKVAVLRAPEQFALSAAPVMDIFNRTFHWFVSLLDWATRLILGLLGIPPTSAHTSAYSLAEFKEMVSGPEVEGLIEPPEREMISAVIDFGELVVRQVAVPRTDIVAVEADTPIREVIEIAIKHSLTKLPVYEDILDQVIGMIHLNDLLRYVWLSKEEDEHTTARDLMSEAIFVPETTSVNQLLKEFRNRHKHIAIVLDEYGGTFGLVTLEDLLDEIIGEMHGPFDFAPPPIQTQADGSSLIDGMTFIQDINDHFDLKLENPEYDTIAGYILSRLGRIPQAGEWVEDRENNIRLKVNKMERLRIAEVLLVPLEKPAPRGAVDDL